MELTAQLAHFRAVLEPDWTPRDQNVEADSLTNEEFGAFSIDLRIPVTMEGLPWLVFPRLVAEARAFYAEAASEAVISGAPAPRRVGRPHALAKRRRGLRDIDPW